MRPGTASPPPTSWSPATPPQTDRDLTPIHWYEVLACYKLGIILEGTHARACAGKAATATGDALHANTLGLFRRALRWID